MSVDMFSFTAGVDLFPCCFDIHGIVSTPVELVVLMSLVAFILDNAGYGNNTMDK